MGGNRGTFGGERPENFGTPESFEKAFSDVPEFNAAPRPVSPETVAAMEPARAVGVKPTPEMGTTDTSTEGRLGKLAVQLSGEVIDDASAKEIERKITELKDDPYELQNYRDRAMVESLKGSFGRVFGSDNNADKQGGTYDEPNR